VASPTIETSPETPVEKPRPRRDTNQTWPQREHVAVAAAPSRRLVKLVRFTPERIRRIRRTGQTRRERQGPSETTGDERVTMSGFCTPDELRTYADLVLRCGINVDAGQKVVIIGDPEHAELIRAIADRAYAAGASLAFALYRDEHVLRAQALHAGDDALARTVSPWYEYMTDLVVDEKWATIVVTGDSTDDPFAGVPPQRVSGLMASYSALIDKRFRARLNWTLVACPTPGWAERVYGEPDVHRLWKDLRFMLRLDEPDPVAAWWAQQAELTTLAERLTDLRFVALRFVGAGSDLRVAMHADARWMAADFETAWGSHCIANLPTEEIFTTPDWRGVEGTVAATRPVQINGMQVDDLVARFEGGRIVDLQASSNADAARAQIAQDEGACRLGEVALVDVSSRVGQTGNVYKEILLDENAACHIAWGSAYEEPFPAGLPGDNAARVARGVNVSHVHQDVMVGGPDVTVLGVTAAGDEVPVLVADRWQI
jgi:aminopeptidase